MATVRENLIAAKALIADPKNWRKGSLGSAGCYCAVGALGVARKGKVFLFSDADVHALAQHVPQSFRGSVPRYNDSKDTTHADIMALFDRAIDALPLHEGSGE